VFCDLFEIWCLRFVILNLVKPVYKCLKTYAQVLTSPLKYHDVKIYARVFRASSTLLLSLTMAEIALCQSFQSVFHAFVVIDNG